MAGDDDEVRATGTEARAGVTLGAMRYVLGISLLLVVVIFIVLLMRPFG